MALKTRKVKVQGLDDYREIVMATYLTSFVLVIILIVNYTVRQMINTFAAVTSLSYFIGATAIILLVFVPKVGLYLVIVTYVTYFVSSIASLLPPNYCGHALLRAAHV